jgi:predicted phosphate transport protein (TIGR00153 family)
MRLSLVPKTTEFYDLFVEAGENAVEAARVAERRFREFPDTDVGQPAVKELEHEGDRLTHDIITLLNSQYVTPIDREDIYSLARRIDDVVDHIEHASDLLGLYKVEGSMEQALQQCRVLVGAAENLASALRELRGLRGVDHYLVALKSLEDEGDRIVRDAIAALFEDEDVSPRVVIAWKDIFDALEDAIDACENAGHVIGNVVVKNA